MKQTLIPNLADKSGTLLSKSFFLVLLACFLPFAAFTQEFAPSYRTGIGVRLGNTPGISVKRFLTEKSALEGIVHVFRSGTYDGFLVTALYQWHTNAFQVQGLNWYFGGGVHAGAYQLRDEQDDTINDPESDNNGTLYGADVVIGLEYQFHSVPFSIGADVKPAITIPNNRVNELSGAVNLRWVF